MKIKYILKLLIIHSRTINSRQTSHVMWPCERVLHPLRRRLDDFIEMNNARCVCVSNSLSQASLSDSNKFYYLMSGEAVSSLAQHQTPAFLSRFFDRERNIWMFQFTWLMRAHSSPTMIYISIANRHTSLAYLYGACGWRRKKKKCSNHSSRNNILNMGRECSAHIIIVKAKSERVKLKRWECTIQDNTHTGERNEANESELEKNIIIEKRSSSACRMGSPIDENASSFTLSLLEEMPDEHAPHRSFTQPHVHFHGISSTDG